MERRWASRRGVFTLPKKKRVTEDEMAGCATTAMDMNLGKLWHAAVYGAVKNQIPVGDWTTATTSKRDKDGTQEAKYLSRSLKGEWQHSNCSKAGRDKESIPESHCCPPKTITALLISYTQNKKLKFFFLMEKKHSRKKENCTYKLQEKGRCSQHGQKLCVVT